MKDSDKVTMTLKQLRSLVKESNFDGNLSVDEIVASLDRRIDDVIYEFQQKAGVLYGDITPEEGFEFDEKVRELAELIAKVIKSQKDGQDF